MPVAIMVSFVLLHSVQQYNSQLYDLTAETIKQQHTIETLHNQIHTLTLNDNKVIPISEDSTELDKIDVNAIELRVKEVLSTRSWKDDSAYIAAHECSFIIKSELIHRGVPFH